MNIAVHQNHAEEKRRDAEFWALQDEILNEFGVDMPEPPKLQVNLLMSLKNFFVEHHTASKRHPNLRHS